MSNNESNKEKRLYSLNLAAYILTTTDLMPVAKIDTDTNTVYFVYPECEAISVAIEAYKKGSPDIKLHKFLAAIKKLRTLINKTLEVKTLEVKTLEVKTLEVKTLEVKTLEGNGNGCET